MINRYHFDTGCGKTFRKKYLRSHINLQHVTVQCQHPGCDRVLSKGRMLTHQRTYVSAKQNWAPYYLISFGYEVCLFALIKYVLECFGFLNVLREDYCIDIFLTSFFRHILHKLPKLSCPHCSLTVTVAAQMKRHIKEVHMLSKRLECPEFGCNLAFKRMTTLKQHQRIHLNNKSFKCKWCNFSGESNFSQGLKT